MKGSVKVMLSYDYCHFEIALASDDDMTIKAVNEMRKQAQRLADEAVCQYVISKDKAEKRMMLDLEKSNLAEEVEKIEKFPKTKWTAEMKAKVKALEDSVYWEQHDYDYGDGEI